MSALAASGGRRLLLGSGAAVGPRRRLPPTTQTPTPTLAVAASSQQPGSSSSNGASAGRPITLLPPPPAALLLAAACVAAARRAVASGGPAVVAAAGACGGGAGGGGGDHDGSGSGSGSSSISGRGPGGPGVASRAPSAQALFGTSGDIDDDGEPCFGGGGAGAGEDGGEGGPAFSAATRQPGGPGPPPAAAFAGLRRAYGTASGNGNGARRAPSPDQHQHPQQQRPAVLGSPSPAPRGDDGEAAATGAGGDAGGGDAAEDAEGVGSELHAVNTAIRANALIFLAKLAAACASGSAAMFAEAVHSLVDVANQTLLRVGILKARRAPTEAHPLGFARDQFIWPLISAVGIFCCGAGVSLVHGVAGLLEPSRELGDLTASYAVLALSLALESHSLSVALSTLRGRARRHGLTLLQYLRTGADPAATAVMMEDGAAVAGLVIAGGCLALCQATGSTAWDSAGSVAVAVLLGGVATVLIQRNRLFLIGRAMPPESERRVVGFLEADPVVRRVRNARSEEIGVRSYRFSGDLAFDGGEVARRCLDRVGRRRLFGALAAAAAARDAGRMDALVTAYSAAVVSATGAEVDRLERQIAALVPGIKHVDLETDREAAGPRRRRNDARQQQQQQREQQEQREQRAPTPLAGAAGATVLGGDGSPAAAAAWAPAFGEGGGDPASADDEVYGGAQLLFGDEDWGASGADDEGGGSFWEEEEGGEPAGASAGGGGGGASSSSGGGSGSAAASPEAAGGWLVRQLPPDGTVEARRARPSMSAALYREREQRVVELRLLAEAQEE